MIGGWAGDVCLGTSGAGDGVVLGALGFGSGQAANAA